MRIAFVTNLCPHYRLPLYEQLAARHEVDYYFFAERERYFNPLLSTNEDQLPRRVLPVRDVFGQPLMPGLTATLSRQRYDVVVKCLNGRLMVPHVFAVARMRRIPFVLWTGVWHHPLTVAHLVSRPLTHAVYRHSDAVVVYGDHVRRFIERTVPRIDLRKIYTAGQAVPSARFEQVKREPSPDPLFLYVGQFEERKGIRVLLEAFRNLKEPRARLQLIGNGSMESIVAEEAERSGGTIELVGHVPQSELPRYLGRAWALVVPSITTKRDREPWGLVVNEAMHAGLPVIASNAVGAAAGGLVRDGVTGVVVAENDADALAASIAAFARDSDRSLELGHEARRAVADYSYERMTRAFERACEHAIRNSSRVSRGGAHATAGAAE